MVCGGFGERKDQQMELDDDDECPLQLAMAITCGQEEGVQSMGLDDLVRLALFADRYEILEVSAAAEEVFDRRHVWAARSARTGPTLLRSVGRSNSGAEELRGCSKEQGLSRSEEGRFV